LLFGDLDQRGELRFDFLIAVAQHFELFRNQRYGNSARMRYAQLFQEIQMIVEECRMGA